MAQIIAISKRFGIGAMLMLMASLQGISTTFASNSITTTPHRAVYQGGQFGTARTNVVPIPGQRVASSTITGTITIAETGAGASHVKVDLYGCFLLTAGGSPRTTVTDVDGNFTFSNVDPGKNRLNFYPDYTQYSAYLASYYAIGGNDIKVYVPENDTLPLNLQLTIGGQVTGHVKSTAGVPLQDIVTVLTDESGNNQYGTTDSAGNYAIIALAPGKYNVLFYTPSNSVSASYAYTLAGTIVVTAPATTANVDGVLVVGGSITGTITAADTGAPAAGQKTVYLENLDGKTYNPWQWLDYSSGSYEFTGLLPGHYRLYAVQGPLQGPYMQTYYTNAMTSAQATTITVSAGKTISNVNIAMAKGGLIKGLVYGYELTSNPVQLVGVEVLDNHDRVVATALTNNQGIYVTTPGIPTGNYRIRFGSPSLVYCNQQFSFGTQYYPATTSLNAALPVSVTAGSITPNIDADITLVLPRVYTPIIRR